jgi:hypothetical protein
MTTKIIRLRFERLRNETHVSYFDALNPLFNTYTPASMNIVPQYTAYKTAFDEEVLSLDIILKSELTAEVIAQDHVRDGTYRGFVEAVQSGTHHFAPAKRDAAKKVLNVVAHYGNIAAHTLDQETAAIDDLLRELAEGPYPAMITTLGIDDWLTQLATDNQQFKSLMADRYHETAQRPAVRMKQTRKATDSAFRALLNQIDALALVNGPDDYQGFISELNAISERFRNIIVQEAGMRTDEEQPQ